MRPVPVFAAGRVSPDVLGIVSGEVGSLATLADVLAWARRRSPPVRVEEIVTQDEYTHDVLLPFDGKHFLAFDAT
jgi:hypothetical protein